MIFKDKCSTRTRRHFWQGEGQTALVGYLSECILCKIVLHRCQNCQALANSNEISRECGECKVKWDDPPSHSQYTQSTGCCIYSALVRGFHLFIPTLTLKWNTLYTVCTLLPQNLKFHTAGDIQSVLLSLYRPVRKKRFHEFLFKH